MEIEAVSQPLATNVHFRTDREEWWNFATHALGFLFAVVAVFFLVPATNDQSWLVALATWFYAANMVALYAASALSHYFHRSELRLIFRKLDQSLIFLFIIAGYTPYCAVHLCEPWAWVGIGLLWLFAIVGFCSKLFFGHRVEGITTSTYLALGWIPALILPFAHSMPVSAISYISIGGLIYMIGVVVLLQDRKAWYLHSIWHGLVVMGTAVHYWGIQQSLATLAN